MSDCHSRLLILESRDCTLLLSSCACHFPSCTCLTLSALAIPNSRPCLHKFNRFFSHQQQWRWSSGQDTASICLANTRHVGDRGVPPRGGPKRNWQETQRSWVRTSLAAIFFCPVNLACHFFGFSVFLKPVVLLNGRDGRKKRLRISGDTRTID